MRTPTLLLSLIPAALAATVSDSSWVTIQSVKQAFTTAGLVPNVIPTFNPTLLLDVKYTVVATGAQEFVTPPGRELVQSEVLHVPNWIIPSSDPSLANQTFLMAMIDPDAPTPANRSLAQARHFIGPGYQLAGPPSSRGTELVSNLPFLSQYLVPTPPPGSDPHRYTFLLFIQPPTFNLTSLPSVFPDDFIHFNITQFAADNNLGDPIAGNFMITPVP